ncbi:MAG: YlxR family protein [Clostridiales bacterium]|nr:YlxR family protein [Clostridiales bacterium]
MPKTKKVPMRMCIACREMKPKQEMQRVVKNADGEIYADPTGKAAGRGAYICNSEVCRQKLNVKKLLHKTFSTDVSMEVYQDIEEEKPREQ